MGKYMKKSKIAGDVAVMEVSPQSFIGVRTRAKTLALQRLQKSSSSSSSSSSSPHPDDSSFSYLQLRSRRLQKVVVDPRKHHQPPPVQPRRCCRESPKAKLCGVAVNSRLRESPVKSALLIDGTDELFSRKIAKGSEGEENLDVCVECSFGENMLEVEGRDRSTRESTPCSLIRDSNAIDPPGSTTRQRTSTFTNQIIRGHMQSIPTAYEMEEFFVYAEKQQQTIFMNKYNFDIVNDVPLPGRYEWVQVLH